MNFLEFSKLFSAYPAISIREIEKTIPGFNLRNLGNWQAKGYLLKIRNGWYALAGRPVSEPRLFAMANQIYTPSYISLERAFSWHGLIPEGVFTITSISSRKTQGFDSPFGRFVYQNLPPRLLTGYRLIEAGGWRFKIAEPEKAILDFLHLRPEYNTPEAIASMRFNPEGIRHLDHEKIRYFSMLFDNKSLERRLNHISYVVSP